MNSQGCIIKRAPGKEGGKVVKALIVRFLKRVALSRVGQLLLVVHLCLVVYGFAQKPVLGPGSIPCVEQPSSAILLAGRSYHFHYESDLIKAVTILDLPALTVGSFPGALLSYLPVCAYADSWIRGVVILTMASIQWLLVGCFLQKSYRALKRGT